MLGRLVPMNSVWQKRDQHMTENGNSLGINQHWHAFLLQHPDARRVVDGVMARTGFSEDTVLFFLINAWAEENLTREQRHEFDIGVCPSVRVN